MGNLGNLDRIVFNYYIEFGRLSRGRRAELVL